MKQFITGFVITLVILIFMDMDDLMITLLSSFLVEESVRLFAAGVILAVEVYRTAKNREIPKNQNKRMK